MKNIEIKDSDLKSSATESASSFFELIAHSIDNAIGGELNTNTMSELNSAQITLLAYSILREEVMYGGFIQLIHNGYGGFIFLNPFSKAINEWGLTELHSMINKCHKLYSKYHEDIEVDLSDEDFMALYEKFAEFDTFDDEFVDNEEKWTNSIAEYVDEHMNDFIKVI
jgi:hypothetical protein